MKVKNVFTSNYPRKGGHPDAYAVSVGPPDYYHGNCLDFLAPTWDMVNSYKAGRITEQEYKEMYITLLERVRGLTPQIIADSLPENCFLLCFESPSKFCHRHLLAEWLNQAEGIFVSEWQNEKELKESKQHEVVDSLLEF